VHVLTVCLNPTIQRTFVVDEFRTGEVNRAVEHRTDASGKGVNVARVLFQLGARASHLTHSGGRRHELFCELARRDGVEIDAVETNIELRVASTIVDRSTNTTTELVEEGREVPADVEGRVRAHFLRHLPQIDGLVISGSKAPGFSTELFAWMVGEARRHDCTVLVDYRGDDLLATMPSRPHFIKPNFIEFVRTFLPELVPRGGLSEHSADPDLLSAVSRKMLELNREYGTTPILTRGPLPTLYVNAGAVEEEQPIEIIPVNTIGSGDAFGAGFMQHRLSVRGGGGDELLQAIRFGHECAAANAQLLKPGSLRP
jgi:fructose-1-phosphate kinase PfkB-like protein